MALSPHCGEDQSLVEEVATLGDALQHGGELGATAECHPWRECPTREIHRGQQEAARPLLLSDIQHPHADLWTVPSPLQRVNTVRAAMAIRLPVEGIGEAVKGLDHAGSVDARENVIILQPGKELRVASYRCLAPVLPEGLGLGEDVVNIGVVEIPLHHQLGVFLMPLIGYHDPNRHRLRQARVDRSLEHDGTIERRDADRQPRVGMFDLLGRIEHPLYRWTNRQRKRVERLSLTHRGPLAPTRIQGI